MPPALLLRTCRFHRSCTRAAAAAGAALLASCVVVPQFKGPPPADCNVITRELTLTVVQGNAAGLCDGRGRGRADDCLVVLAATGVVFIASAVVSGSVVIVGNTLHWMERAQRCDRPAEMHPPGAPSAPQGG